MLWWSFTKWNYGNQTTMRMASVFDDMGKMLLNLTKLLPRFEAYVHILPTPRLHDALREVYGLYIDFAFLVIKFLNSNKCCEFR